MNPEQPPRPRRGTPISDGLGAELQALGSILANHTRGLDEYLQRQAHRLDDRQQMLLAETTAFLLPSGLDLEAMTVSELKSLCRQKQFRGWSQLRRDDLLAFVKLQLAAELAATPIQHQEPAEGAPEAEATGIGTPADASRTERLLLLVLRHLGVPQEEVEATWLGACCT
ncbi:MAG: hypothetical protein NTV57_19480 [Cyanobacteria bacterium]|nr:hypothetical protein [Cyanobacteriota bacterium]